MTNSKMSLDDVLDALMLEEDQPTYAALLRWTERYPDYRDSLTDFFATWAMQDLHAEHAKPARIDEGRLVEQGVAYALEIARRQGRVVPAGTIEPLQPFDQLVLAAVYLLNGRCYSVNITERISEMSGRRVLLGSTFATLDRLEQRGLVLARYGDPETESEGKTRRYYIVTVLGERALAYAKETSKEVADFLGDFA